MKVSLLLTALLLFNGASALSPIQSRTTFVGDTQSSHPRNKQPWGGKTSQSALFVRGGGVESILPVLQSGSEPMRILTLWTVASSVVFPFTLFSNKLAFSVGYGYSIMILGLVVLKSLGATITTDATKMLLAVTILHGFRLGTFNSPGEIRIKGMKESIDKSSKLLQIPFALITSLVYAMTLKPLLYAARESVVLSPALLQTSFMGAVLAWIGFFVQSVTVKPPNYLGDIIFRIGIILGGAPYFGTNPIPWICSLFSYYGMSVIKNSSSDDDDDAAKPSKVIKKEKSVVSAPPPPPPPAPVKVSSREVLTTSKSGPGALVPFALLGVCAVAGLSMISFGSGEQDEDEEDGVESGDIDSASFKLSGV